MDYTTLGRTGLRVSVAGLGCGGVSKLGLRDGNSEADAVAIVQHALEQGINLIDTARQYDTEAVVGRAIKGRRRDAVVISGKAQTKRGDALVSAADMVADMETSLRLLGTDHMDIFHLQGARPEHYDRLLAEHVPALLRERDKGKFRFLGITENQPEDAGHGTAARVVKDEPWDVMMIAFHMLHQGPRKFLPKARAKGIGVMAMYALRNIFSRPERLRHSIGEAIAAGLLPPDGAEDALGFLVRPGGARNIVDAALRYVRHEPGVDVTLFGTGSVAHLDANIASVLAPALPEADRRRLGERFGHLVLAGLEKPDHHFH